VKRTLGSLGTWIAALIFDFLAEEQDEEEKEEEKMRVEVCKEAI